MTINPNHIVIENGMRTINMRGCPIISHSGPENEDWRLTRLLAIIGHYREQYGIDFQTPVHKFVDHEGQFVLVIGCDDALGRADENMANVRAGFEHALDAFCEPAQSLKIYWDFEVDPAPLDEFDDVNLDELELQG